MLKIHKINAGHYWSDGGALLGVLPYALWKDKTETDELRRKKMELNLVLIESEDRLILVDTGIGNRLSDKQKKIYRPSDFLLPYALYELGFKDKDITDVIMTHLHFDHAGGVMTGMGESDVHTFPRAKYWIQKSEWEIAKAPDGLNKAAYDFEHQLSKIRVCCQLNLIEGDVEIAKGVRAIHCGGHTVGTQYVEIDADDGFYIYAGDIIGTMFHTSPAITSAYDVNRKETFAAKQRIYQALKEKNGTLLLNHDEKRWDVHISELRV